ncbi:MAG: hypothetical protein Q8Q02_02015 [Nocardioides sp.]|nr:hypothetical protein [Nocardioides sp.]
MAVLFTAMMLVLVTASPGTAGTFQTVAKWKNCETTKAGITIRGTFAGPAALYGPGRFKVKKAIRWDVYKGDGKWRVRDNVKTSTEWMKIRNPNYDLVTSIGDRTTWGNIYRKNWRAHVTLTLIKYRRGPANKKVDKIDIYPQKGSFKEKGSCSGDMTAISG